MSSARQPVCWWGPLFLRWLTWTAWPRAVRRFWRIIPHRIVPVMITSRTDKFANCDRCNRNLPYEWPVLAPLDISVKLSAVMEPFVTSLNDVGAQVTRMFSGGGSYGD